VTLSPARSERGDATASPRSSASPDQEVPVRADGVQLIGEMPGSGYRTPPALVRRADGQTIQLTPLLYLVLEGVDGRRTHAEISERVSAAFGRRVSAENVATLVDQKLRPIGVLLKGDGSEPELKKSNPLLGIHHRVSVTDPVKTERLTAPFARLFNPVLVVAVTAAFLWLTWWLLLDKGLASATHDAFHRPGLLLAVFLVTVLSAGFHEFGHAAAARRGGASPGVMGMGLYLFWPAFYTDVTDSYRLGRVGRLRTDLGGLYFNALVAVGIVGAWWLTHNDALLLVVATQILQMLRQLTPMIRFDGYHVLADLTGVPDLYHHIKPILISILPWRWRDPKVTVLKPWARGVVTLWVLIVVPVLVFTLVSMVVALPRLIATAWVSLREQASILASAWADGEMLAVAARALAIAALVLPILGIGYVLTRLVRQVVGSTWRRTAGKPFQRAVAGVTAAAIVAALGWVWWPDEDTYRPVARDEGGTLVDVLPTQLTGALPVARAGAAYAGLEEGAEGLVTTAWPKDEPLPTKAEPELALVMVPHEQGVEPGTEVGSGSTTGESVDGTDGTPSPDGEEAGSWVFPFNRPLPPDAGDTQALAANTTDDTVAYDLAFAMIWADEEQVTNTNEAYAFASCQNCAAVAVSFQVVLIVGDSEVIVPQNIAAAVNYDCVQCLTYALASQLVVTIDGPLTDKSMAALGELWAEIAAFAGNIASVPLAELQATLEEYQEQIKDIIREDPAAQEALLLEGEQSDPGQESGTPSDSSNAGGTEATTEPSPTAGTTDESGGSPTAEPSQGAPSESPAPAPEQPGSTTAPSPTAPAPTPAESTQPSTAPLESPAATQ
jgi:putative peptide zinc metalloprotease protein